MRDADATTVLPRRALGRCGIEVSTIGFGAFKIGRNTGTKYDVAYELPSMSDVRALLWGLADLGINYIDTAPAYGLSEERIGAALGSLRNRFVLSSKVGETFADGCSTYDFGSAAVRRSVENSLRLTCSEALDVLFVHANADDLAIVTQSDIVPTLLELRARGWCRAIGLSAKTPAGARAALAWADVLMLEYHLQERSFEPVIAECAARGVGVVVKKALASGRLAAQEGLHFVLSSPGVASAVVGALSATHLRENARIAAALGR